MLVLASTTDTLEVDLLAAHTTNPLRCVAMYRDITTTAYTPGRNVVNTNGTTDVVLVAAPAASTQRVIDFLNVYNTDTVGHTVTIRYVDNATEYSMFVAVLGVGEWVQYTNEQGWQVFANNGAVKQANVPGTNPVTSGMNLVTLGADVTNNNAVANTIADVTGLSFAVTAGQRYYFRSTIQYTAAATTTGSRWSVSGPGAPTELRYKAMYSLTTTTQTTIHGSAAYDLPAASNASSAAIASNIARVEGFILPSANGTVTIRFASEIASSAIVAKRGSILEWAAVG